MKFEREKAKPIEPVSEKQLLRGLGFMLRPSDCRIAILTVADGSYIQVGGSGMSCVLERRTAAGSHFRASQHPPVVPWAGITELRISGGLVRLRQEEFFRMSQVQDAFLAFYRGAPFPTYIQWRDISHEVAAICSNTNEIA
ncbi:MAG TPA: hypothetical protein VF585_03865 [Chthoniobacterales bacterium]